MTKDTEQKLGRQIDSLSELLEIKIQQTSGHQSDILKQIGDINTRVMNLENNFNTFRGEVQPMLNLFKDNQVQKVVIKKWGITIYKKSVWIGTVAIALGVLWAFIKFGGEILLHAIQNK